MPIAYTYLINGEGGVLFIWKENGIKETYSYYSHDNEAYYHYIWGFYENGRKTSLKVTGVSVSSIFGEESYESYMEYSYDSNGNEIGSKGYFFNRDGELELHDYTTTVYDGLGNRISFTAYDENGEITAKIKY